MTDGRVAEFGNLKTPSSTSNQRYRGMICAILPILLCLLFSCRQSNSNLENFLPSRPGINVLVVSFDALRADALGVYGSARGASPAIDAFSRTAVVFEDAVSAAQATPTSFAASFTGRWPHEVFLGWHLRAEQTLASVLSRAGYQTAFISNNIQLVRERGFGLGFDLFEVADKVEGPDSDQDGVTDDSVILSRATEWLEKEAREPFFLWIHFLSPHSPYTVYDSSSHFYDPAYRGPFGESTGHSFEISNPADLARARDLYTGEVFQSDRSFSQVWETLQRLGYTGRTLVILTSDHGDEFLEHGRLQHHSVFQEVVRIPLIVHHPTAQGHRVAIPASNVDLLPTIANILGAPFDRAQVDGVDLTGRVSAKRLRVSVSMTHGTEHFVTGIVDRRKLIVECAIPDRPFLFDLNQDPGEETNLAEEDPTRVRDLLSQLSEELDGDTCQRVQNAIRGVPPDVGLSARALHQLRALGYLQETATPKPKAGTRLWSEPDPVPLCGPLLTGQAEIHWRASASYRELEVWVGPGKTRLFARGGHRGSAETGPWVKPGTRFSLIEPRSSAVLSELILRTTGSECNPPLPNGRTTKASKPKSLR